MNTAASVNQYPNLKNAPIVEALLDIRVQIPAENKSADLIEELHKKIQSDFPIAQKLFILNGHFEFKAEDTKLHPRINDSIINGFLFQSENKNKAVQFRFDGFTFNLQKPYSNWNDFRDLAGKYWDLYRSSISPVSITRIALRYINKIELPSKFNPEDYFLTRPILGDSLESHSVYNLFSQISIKNSTTDCFANITEGIEQINQEKCNFILDIDVFYDGDLSGNFWKKFEDLHQFKNEIFFGSLTGKTITLLK